MNAILDPVNRAALLEWLSRGTLLAFDYDGTLAPIVGDRESAVMRDTTRELLRRVARRFRTVIVSGRARQDLVRLTRGVAVAELVGNHGCETAGLDASWAIAVAASWEQRLAPALRDLHGVDIENKRMTLAIHYRAAAEGAGHLVRERLAGLDGARIVGGKKVWNVLPIGLPHKGDAVLRLCRLLHCGRYLFVGDDETDESVFSLAGSVPGIGIRVGRSEGSAAAYCIDDQRGIDELLAIFADAPRENS